MISEDEYREACDAKKAAELVINEFHKQELNTFEERLKSGRPFTDDELTYAAYARCRCGQGLAYSNDCGIDHYWECSAILKGTPDLNVAHDPKYPFSCYSIKSEGQPSAYGHTTRPAGVIANRQSAIANRQ